MLKKRSISWFDSEIDQVGFCCKPIYFNVAAFMLETITALLSLLIVYGR